MKIISIDPSGNGVCGMVMVEWDDDIEILDFANIDFRANDTTNPEQLKEQRYRGLVQLIDYIKEQEPDLVILENFIMFRVQMGAYGQSFITSEMIGVIDWEMRKLEIPVIKPRSSDVRGPFLGYYPSGQPKPKKFKPNLTNQAFKERGLLKTGPRNVTQIIVKGEPYTLKDYAIGSKNDHVLMALRHVVNLIDSKATNIDKRINDIIRDRFEKEIND